MNVADLTALAEAHEQEYELKQNLVVNVGYYFVPAGDRDDAPKTFATIAAAWLAIVERYEDPTLWCNACGARRQAQCDCPPIAENE